jgi:hypothetical protein
MKMRNQRLGLIAVAVLSTMIISVTATQKSYAQSIVTAYNIQDVDPPTKTVKFTQQVLVDILTGKITKWNDPQIQALNPGESLPAAKIYLPGASPEILAYFGRIRNHTSKRDSVQIDACLAEGKDILKVDRIGAGKESQYTILRA